jgi:hypothetical protein
MRARKYYHHIASPVLRLAIPANSFGAIELYIRSFLEANTAVGVGGAGIQNPSWCNDELLEAGDNDELLLGEEVYEAYDGGADCIGDELGPGEGKSDA